MSGQRVTLDNPVFSGTLRQASRSVPYIPSTRGSYAHATAPRPASRAVMQDGMLTARSLRPRSQSPTQPGRPKQHIVQASSVRQVQVSPGAAPIAAPVSGLQEVKKSRRPRMPKKLQKQHLMYAAAALIFVLGLGVSISGMMTNKKVEVQVKTMQKAAAQAAPGSAPAVAPPSTEKPTETAVRTYVAPPDVPRYIDIPKLKVHARVRSVGVDRKNQLIAPLSIHDTGWYNASSKPGENGAMLVDGHSGLGNIHGVFARIAELGAGDVVSITRGDGQVFSYKVVHVEIVDVENVPMNSLLVSKNTAKPGLNLITCAGDEIPGTFTLKQRALVYAVMD